MIRTFLMSAVIVAFSTTLCTAADEEEPVVWVSGQVSAPIDLEVQKGEVTGILGKILRIFDEDNSSRFSTEKGFCYLSTLEGEQCPNGSASVEHSSGNWQLRILNKVKYKDERGNDVVCDKPLRIVAHCAKLQK